MKRRTLILKTGTVGLASLLSGCTKQLKSPPTRPRELRIDSSHPLIDGEPKVQKRWEAYATILTEKTDLKRFEQNVAKTKRISDWKPINFPQQFISVASVVVPVTKTLQFKKIELQGNECQYKFRVVENESSDPDLPKPYLFNVVDLWNLNGHNMPKSAAVHIDGVSKT